MRGYDIDGDGQIDVREMRLAKFLDAMMDSRRQLSSEQQEEEPGECDVSRMRQEAGRLLIAKEFVERNHDRLWRYGSIFTGKTEEQGAELIAAHKNFKYLMPFLESLERKRTIRSSQNVRECMQQPDESYGFHDAQQDAKLVRQTWIETSRKVPGAPFSRHPLPELQPRKKVNLEELHPVSESIEPNQPEVVFNAYGAIDVDGDGVVDGDEMKLNQRLQETALADNNHAGHLAVMDLHEMRQLQQHDGRLMMAKDFVERNKNHLWLFEPSFRDKPADQIAHEIATNVRFAREFNKLRAKERVLQLKSSERVSNCLMQMPTVEQTADPSKAMEFRRVRHRSELLLARKELLKPRELQASSVQHAQQPNRGGVPQLRAVREDRRELSRTLSDTHIAGLPKIYDAPVRIEATGSFSITKWKFSG